MRTGLTDPLGDPRCPIAGCMKAPGRDATLLCSQHRKEITVSDPEVLTWLMRWRTVPFAAQRAHAVLLQPRVIMTLHPCGHSSWINYDFPAHQGGLSETACRMCAGRWTAQKGGVTAPCPTCCPPRPKQPRSATARKVRVGPSWRGPGAWCSCSLKGATHREGCPYFGCAPGCDMGKHVAGCAAAERTTKATYADSPDAIGRAHWERSEP